jgi:dethiobiotin synthetase/adenosylmethionine--8-amino-7-oxononanoate aminotransferase
LGCKPDIACYSKLLTGGVVPLGATLASESVFETFMGNSKVITNLLVLNPSLATFTSR